MRNPRRFRLSLNLWLALLLALPLGAVSAAPPAVTAIYPAGGQVGTAFSVTVSGNLGKAPVSVWVDHPGLVFKPGAKPGLFDLTIAPEVPVGPHLVRFYNEDGASSPRTWMIGLVQEIADNEPNDDALRQGQELPNLPVTVNGKLDKSGDADSFKVILQEGQWVVATLHGYGLGTQMDPALRLLDEKGTEIVLEHDGYNLDPTVSWQVKKTGAYYLQVMGFSHPPAADVNLKGGVDFVYRLNITQAPVTRYTWPLGVKRGAKTTVQPLGWNLGPEWKGAPFEIDAASNPVQPEASFIVLPGPDAEPVRVALHDAASEVVLEVEPNQKGAEATPMPVPAAVQGVLQTPGDEDRFPFQATKGQSYLCKVNSAVLHTPVDAWLRVEDATGKVLVQADDTKDGTFDPSLTWKAPADGRYVLAVGDRYQRGGWDYGYQLEVTPAPAAPRLQATLAEHAVKLEPGKSVEVKVKTEITGEFKGKLTTTVTGLPEGVTAKEVEVSGKKSGEVVVKLEATAEAKPGAGPVEVVIATSAPEAPAVHKAMFDLRGVEPRGDRLTNEDARVWLTVEPAAK